MTQLALYESAREALATAVRVDEVVDIRDRAERAKAYAKIARDRRLQADAGELVQRAERKLGIMLRQIKEGGLLSQGGRPAERSNLSEPETGDQEEPVFDATPFTLADIGVSKKLSSRAQKQAALEDEAFEASVKQHRDKVLGEESAAAPKVRTVRAPKAAKPVALEPRKFHQFAFAVLAMSLRAPTVSSDVLQFFARNAGLVEGEGEAMEFTAAAAATMGVIAQVALANADDLELPGTAEGPGGGESAAPDFLQRAQLREAYEGEVALLSPQKGKLTKQTAEAAMRAGYAAEVPLAIMCEDLGHPHGTLATWANRLGLTSRDRMLAHQYRTGGEA